MVAMYLAPIYAALNIYLLIRIIRFFAVVHEKLRHPVAVTLSIGIYVYFMLTPLLGFLIQAEPFHRMFKRTGNYWLGFLAIGLVVTVLFDIGRVILNRTLWKDDHPNEKRYRIGAACALIIVCVISGYGFHHYKDIKINENSIKIDKALVSGQTSLKVVLVADLHIGYSIGYEHIDKTVSKINSQKPDIVLVAGDIFDNEYEAVKNPDKIAKRLAEIESRYGVYGCWGNHDIPESLLAGFTVGKDTYEKDDRFIEFLEKSDIKMLEDESELINGDFYIAGRKDPQMAEKLGESRKSEEELTKDMDKTKPILMMEHEPDDLGKAQQAGVDVDFSGHTHNGQIFPGNLLVKFSWENPAGIIEKGNMKSCVTQGVGVWGPAMRLGTDSEIMVIDIEFN